MEKKLTPPPAVKSTGIEWLGEIPRHWDVLPGYSLMKERSEKNVGLKEDTILSLSYGQVIVKPKDKLHGLVPESFETYQIVNPGNVIIRPTDLQNDKTSLRVGLAKNRGIITSAYLCLETSPRLLPEFGYNLLHSYDVMKIFYGLGSGLRQNLDFKDIKRLPILLPSLEEQQKIVSFIQQQDRRIRKFIRNKIKFIKLLELQRTLVTQGLLFEGLENAQKSRVAIFEQHIALPAHWRVLRARFVFRAITRRDVLPEDQKLSVTQKRGIVPTDQMEENSTQAESYDNFQVCHVGDLVANKYKAHLGVFCCAFQRGIITPNYSVFRTVGKQHTYYFDLLFHSPFYRSVFSKIVYGVTEGMSPLYTQDFYNVPVVVPPYDEQVAITAAISQKTSAIADVISQHEREIALIEEYRARLIADAVTGKIDLRNFQPSDEAESPDTDSDLSMHESDEINEDYKEDEALLAEAVNAD